jgi:hypothetical protein
MGPDNRQSNAADAGEQVGRPSTPGRPFACFSSDWLVSSHENNDLVVLYARTGRICFCLHTDSSLAILELSGHICMGLGTEAGLWTWSVGAGVPLLLPMDLFHLQGPEEGHSPAANLHSDTARRLSLCLW